MPSLREMMLQKQQEEVAARAAEQASKVQAVRVEKPHPVSSTSIETTIEPASNQAGHVPSTDDLRVVVKLLTGITIRGSGADARKAIQAWSATGAIPKARRH